MNQDIPFPPGCFTRDFSAQEVDAIWACVPREHQSVDQAGHTCLTELGIIYMTTAIENLCPDQARIARDLRYAFSRYCARARKSQT